MIAVATVPRTIVRIAPFLVVWLLSSGCVSQPLVQLRPQPYNPLTERLKLSARGRPKPSGQTRLFLRCHDLPDKIGHNPRRLLNSLAEVHRKSPSRESSYALAELSYIVAKQLETFNSRAAIELYFNSVASAYSYLFDPRFETNVSPYDPRFRGACDLYNSALESCLRIVRNRGDFRPGQKFAFTVAG